MVRKALFALLIVGLAASGCGDKVDGQLAIQLVAGCRPALADVADGIESYCVAVDRLDGQPAQRSCASRLEDLQLRVDAAGGRVVVVLEGVGAGGEVLVRGSSPETTLISGVEDTLSVPMALVGRFSLVAGLDSGCTPLPGYASAPTATAFPSGHLVVSGSGGDDPRTGTPVAMLDCNTYRVQQLHAPDTMRRIGQAAVVLSGGRLLFAGGELLDGSAAMELVVVRGTELLEAPYNRAIDYPGGLNLEVLTAGLRFGREMIDAAVFFGDQVVLADGNDPVEMFLGADEACGPLNITGGQAYPMDLTTTTLPLTEGRGLILGGAVNHAGFLTVASGSRDAAYSPIAVNMSRRYRPLALPVTGGRILVLGGMTVDPATESPVLLVDAGREAVLQVPVPEEFPYSDFTASLLPDGRVFVVGGRSLSASAHPGGTFFLNPSDDADTWTVEAGPALVLPRAGHAAALLPDGRLAVVGGYSPVTGSEDEAVARSIEVIAF